MRVDVQSPPAATLHRNPRKEAAFDRFLAEVGRSPRNRSKAKMVPIWAKCGLNSTGSTWRNPTQTIQFRSKSNQSWSDFDSGTTSTEFGQNAPCIGQSWPEVDQSGMSARFRPKVGRRRELCFDLEQICATSRSGTTCTPELPWSNAMCPTRKPYESAAPPSWPSSQGCAPPSGATDAPPPRPSSAFKAAQSFSWFAATVHNCASCASTRRRNAVGGLKSSSLHGTLKHNDCPFPCSASSSSCFRAAFGSVSAAQNSELNHALPVGARAT